MSRRPSTALFGRVFEPPDPEPVAEVIADRFAREAGVHVERPSGLLEFAQAVPTAKRPFDPSRFPFQVELLDEHGEFDAEQVLKKATQLGISEILLRWCLLWADRGRTAMQVMPTGKHASEFSDMRIKDAIRKSDYLRSRTASDDIDTKRLKKVGAGFYAIRGSQSKDELDSVDADVLGLDEYNRLVQGHIADAEQRVTGPLSEGLVRRVGVPTVPNFGIAKAFATSDQRRWWVKCGSCPERQPMSGAQTLRENVDQDKMRVVCRRCRKPLDVRAGEWVAEFPDRDVRGYHLPKFVVPLSPQAVAKIVGNSRATRDLDRQTHHNKDLGEEWASEEGRLSPAALAAAERRELVMTQGYDGPNFVTMGVDVADVRALNVRISEHLDEHHKRMLWAGLVDGDARGSAFQKLERLMDRYSVNMACLDHAPSGRLSRAFCGRFRGRAYKVALVDKQTNLLNVKEPESLVTVRKLEAFDATLDLIRSQRNLIAPDRPDDYDEQMGNVVLSQEENDKGDVRQFWQSTGPDDWPQAECYDLIATHMLYVRQHVAAGEAVRDVVTPARDEVDFEQVLPSDEYSEGPSDEPMGGW